MVFQHTDVHIVRQILDLHHMYIIPSLFLTVSVSGTPGLVLKRNTMLRIWEHHIAWLMLVTMAALCERVGSVRLSKGDIHGSTVCG